MISEQEAGEVLGGLRFVPAYQLSGANMKKHLMAVMMAKPTFTSLDQFGRVLNTLDDVSKKQVWLVDQERQEAEDIDDYRAIVSNATGKVYSIRSSKYVPVQDYEVAKPFYDAVGEMGVNVSGRIDGVGTGRTVGHFIIHADGFSFNMAPAQGEEDLGAIGVKWWNSYTGESSFGGEIFIIRSVCSNYMAVGPLLGKFSKAHLGSMEGVMLGFKQLISQAVNNVPKLKAAVQKAALRPVLTVEMPDLLWGIDMPVTAIDDIGLAPSSYTPEIGDQMTLWNLYNATTAWISYRNNSGQAMKTTEKMAARALNLLTQNPEDIILAGQKRRREYEEAIKRKIEAEEDRKRTKAQEVQAGLKARGVDAW